METRVGFRWFRVTYSLVGALMLSGCASTSHSGSSGGEAGSESGVGEPSAPKNSHVAVLRQASVDKVDVLLTIDNSESMKDKQQLLADAVPYLVQRLLTPRCVRTCTPSDNCTPRQQAEGIPVDENADAQGVCPSGAAPELAPIRDLHFAVISSSLGAHGASGPGSLCTSQSEDDHAQLLGALRGVAGTFQSQGFLAWAPNGADGADIDSEELAREAATLVTSAGDSGCQLPATLEAWYRFLIDPEPPASVTKDESTATIRIDGVDQTVLDQRAAFLRPDSLVVIGMLSDKNDCSVIDSGYGWMVASDDAMPLATSACAANPNDNCCQSCAESTAHVGCPPIASDSVCKAGSFPDQKDPASLRCWEQKRRFGIDFLYPTSRYVDALKSPVVQLRAGEFAANPLFAAAAGRSARDPGLVQLFGIVGVPWQDIADEDSQQAPFDLVYLAKPELDALGRWPVILGDPRLDIPAPVLPSDPFMVESVAERTGNNPVTNEPAIASSASSGAKNAINGREHRADGEELQYACTFPLPEPRVCDSAAEAAGEHCDCFEADAEGRPSLCQSPSGGDAGTTQYFAKAYPSRRLLEVLKGHSSSTVASICPKNVDDTAPSYGYAPAIDAVVRSARDSLRSRCFPFALPLDPALTGAVEGCQLVTTFPKPAAGCDCAAHGWRDVGDPAALDGARRALANGSSCSLAGATTTCDQFCFCEVPQLEGKDLAACQLNNSPPSTSGFCYVNGQAGEPQVGNPALLQSCSASDHRLLRVTGEPILSENVSVVVCDSAIAPELP